MIALLTFVFDLGNLRLLGVNNPSLTFHALSLGISLSTLGFLFSLSSIFSALTRLPTGVLIDKYGSKSLLIAGFILSSAALVLGLSSTNHLTLGVAMIFGAMAAGIHFPSQRHRIAKSTNVHIRSRGFSLLFVAQGSAGLIGPTISGLLSENYGLRIPMACGLIIIIMGLASSLRLPKIKEDVKPETSEYPTSLSLSIRRIEGDIWILYLFRFVKSMMFGTGVLLSIFLKRSFNISYVEIGLILTSSSILGIFSNLIAGRASTTKRRLRILFFSAMYFPILTSFGLVFRVEQAIPLILGLTMTHSFIMPTEDALIGDLARRSRVGLVFGLADTFMMFGSSLGSLLSGFIAEIYGVVSAFRVMGIISLMAPTLALAINRRATSKSKS